MNAVKRKKLIAIALLVICVGILLFYPFETTVVPEWKIRVIDEAGKPLQNIVVNELWRHHSLEFQRHNEDRITDIQGYVLFPRRTVRASLLFRIVGRAVVALNVHGESGPKASAMVRGPYLTSRDPEYSPSKPVPEVIVVKPQP
jgi:hypothetical protein